jgi:hypothetical protein
MQPDIADVMAPISNVFVHRTLTTKFAKTVRAEAKDTKSRHRAIWAFLNSLSNLYI